ncbi:hypothetical protein ANN_04069 [Periplaneta americana]|uniref:Uncharacterized protein n=1 Tax=Periplaneta americana TaxID=6978 RepID=A0ABQ8T7J6_PERAM|nr:hypothetical protein ANN_04069 [Periplaneta americana]
MAGLCEGGNELPGSLKAITGRNLLFRNNTAPTPSCSLVQLLRARSTALRKACSDSETTENSPNHDGSGYTVLVVLYVVLGTRWNLELSCGWMRKHGN